MKQIKLRYARQNPNGITTDYENFLIHNSDGHWHLLKETSYGYEIVIKPNGTFTDEYLPRIVLGYIEAEKGYRKDTEQILDNAE